MHCIENIGDFSKVLNSNLVFKIQVPGIIPVVKIVAPEGAISNPVVRLLFQHNNNFKYHSKTSKL